MALENEDTQAVLRIVGELVDATEETPLLPQDLNTTIGIITATLDLLFSDLNSAAGQNVTNTTIPDVSFSASSVLKINKFVTDYSGF